jgi:hypothetical protein
MRTIILSPCEDGCRQRNKRLAGGRVFRRGHRRGHTTLSVKGVGGGVYERVIDFVRPNFPNQVLFELRDGGATEPHHRGPRLQSRLGQSRFPGPAIRMR